MQESACGSGSAESGDARHSGAATGVASHVVCGGVGGLQPAELAAISCYTHGRAQVFTATAAQLRTMHQLARNHQVAQGGRRVGHAVRLVSRGR